MSHDPQQKIATDSGPKLGSVQTPSSHSLSLPSPSLFHSSPLILSSPWPWVTSRPSVPSGFPEPAQSTVVPVLLSWSCCQLWVQGNTQSQMHVVSSKNSMSCGQSAMRLSHQPLPAPTCRLRQEGSSYKILEDPPRRWRVLPCALDSSYFSSKYLKSHFPP